MGKKGILNPIAPKSTVQNVVNQDIFLANMIYTVPFVMNNIITILKIAPRIINALTVARKGTSNPNAPK